MPVIDPQLILITGDMVHGDSSGMIPFNENEWLLYTTPFKNSIYKNRILDIRGNHEARGISEYNDLYLNYSFTHNNKPVYNYIYKLNNYTKYNFIGLDMNILPGTRSVINSFNFFGSMVKQNLDQLNTILNTTKVYYNYIIILLEIIQ